MGMRGSQCAVHHYNPINAVARRCCLHNHRIYIGYFTHTHTRFVFFLRMNDRLLVSYRFGFEKPLGVSLARGARFLIRLGCRDNRNRFASLGWRCVFQRFDNSWIAALRSSVSEFVSRSAYPSGFSDGYHGRGYWLFEWDRHVFRRGSFNNLWLDVFRGFDGSYRLDVHTLAVHSWCLRGFGGDNRSVNWSCHLVGGLDVSGFHVSCRLGVRPGLRGSYRFMGCNSATRFNSFLSFAFIVFFRRRFVRTFIVLLIIFALVLNDE